MICVFSKHEDLVQGNFEDTYHNLAYKATSSRNEYMVKYFIIKNLIFTMVDAQLIRMKMTRTEHSYVRRVLEKKKPGKIVTNMMENHIIKLVILEYRIIKVTWLHIVMELLSLLVATFKQITMDFLKCTLRKHRAGAISIHRKPLHG